MARIFVSYAREDQAAAKRIVDALAREGFDAWWDHEIPPGRSWDEVIGTRIASAQAVIVLWSARSLGSNFVKEEAQLAYDAGKLLPVKVEDVEPPVGFRRVHAANLADWRGEANHAQWRALLGEVRERLGAEQPASTRSPVRRAPATPQSAPRDVAHPPIWYWIASLVFLVWAGLQSLWHGSRAMEVIRAEMLDWLLLYLPALLLNLIVAVLCVRLMLRTRWATPLFVIGLVMFALYGSVTALAANARSIDTFAVRDVIASALLFGAVYGLSRIARAKAWIPAARSSLPAAA